MILLEGKMRIDKWLWAVRIYKSRSLAQEACANNKILQNEKPVKPSHNIGIGDRITVKKDGFHLQFEITGLLKSRAGAPIAQQCYVNHTPEEELTKFDDWKIGGFKSEFREKGSGRPTKKERRQMDSLKGK